MVLKNIGGDNLTTSAAPVVGSKRLLCQRVDMRVDQLEVARLESIVAALGDQAAFVRPAVEGEEKSRRHSTWVVSGRAKMLPVVKLYFDKESGILLSTLYQQQSEYCCHVFRIDYDAYWPVNGVRMPSRWTVNGPRQAILVYEINDVQVNTAVEDARFAKPAGTQ